MQLSGMRLRGQLAEKRSANLLAQLQSVRKQLSEKQVNASLVCCSQTRIFLLCLTNVYAGRGHGQG